MAQIALFPFLDKISKFNRFVKNKLCTEQYFILEHFNLTLEINIV